LWASRSSVLLTGPLHCSGGATVAISLIQWDLSERISFDSDG
jgi:hypothetical protein